MAYATMTMSQCIQGAPAVPVSLLSILLVKMVKVGYRYLSKTMGDQARKAVIHPSWHARERSRGNSDPRPRYSPNVQSFYRDFLLIHALFRCSTARLNRSVASSRIFLKAWMLGPSTSFQTLHLHPHLHLDRLGILHHPPCQLMTYTGLWKKD
jgi:hypothetical protein